MKVTVGVLLITYQGANDEQPIRWVRLDDFTRLQQFVTNQTSLNADLRRIRAEVARLRTQGVTDAQLRGAGIDLSRLAPTDATWPLRSYVITTKYGIRFLDFNRTHTLRVNTITSVRLVQQQRVEE